MQTPRFRVHQRLTAMLRIIRGTVTNGGLFIAGTVLLLGWIHNFATALGEKIEMCGQGDTHVY